MNIFILIFRLSKKKMELFKNLVKVSSEIGKINDFFEFTKDIYKLIGHKKTDCDILSFLVPLEEVFSDPDKGYDFQRNFFMLHCLKHPNVLVVCFS